MRYFLDWKYDESHLMAEVTKESFFKIIKSVSKDFSVHEDELGDLIEYWFENNEGKSTYIGYISKDKRRAKNEFRNNGTAYGRKMELIELGRNEAWEAARKLVSMGYKGCNEVLGDGVLTVETIDEIFVRCTASEAIAKIREYEEKKQEDGEIKVGDEVIYHDDKGVVVLVANNGKAISVMSAYGGWMIRTDREELVKTGRTFPEIAEVLAKMQEGE